MKILFISCIFPPYNASGAIRVGKLVAHLSARGHDIRVVTGKGLPFPANFELSTDAMVERVAFPNIAAPIDWMRARLAKRTATAAAGGSERSSGLLQGVANLYRALIAIPDSQVGWLPGALRAARRIVIDWKPDVIVSSALPFTCHLVAARMARETGRPWIAEFRDLFADNPYNEVPRWRRRINHWIERRTLVTAAACVTVSPSLAKALTSRHRKPAFVILNGFDPADVADCAQPLAATGRPLRIVYTGIIYPGKRDPRPLFKAIRGLGDRGRRVQVAFYGQDLRGVRELAAAAGVADSVTTHAPVAYAESIRLQCQADLLLLLLWDDAREHGVYTGKLFEYVGARRPILAIGCADGVAANLVRERDLGVPATQPAEIAAALDRWIVELDREGTIAPPPVAGMTGLSRPEQFEQYELLLQRVAAGGAPGLAS